MKYDPVPVTIQLPEPWDRGITNLRVNKVTEEDFELHDLVLEPGGLIRAKLVPTTPLGQQMVKAILRGQGQFSVIITPGEKNLRINLQALVPKARRPWRRAVLIVVWLCGVFLFVTMILGIIQMGGW